MNESGTETTLLQALLLTPLALVADSVLSGLAIGAMTLLTTLTILLSANGLTRLAAHPQRQTILLIIAALTTALGDLLLRAFAIHTHAALAPWLPLTAVTSVLLVTLLKPTDKPTLKSISLLLGFAAIPPLLVGGVRELTGVLFILPTAGVLLSIALLVAAKNYWLPARKPSSPAANNPGTRRVRVTGPIS